jgi:putative ABC transport system permease protein
MNPAHLAWRQLMKEKSRVAAAVSGILVAVVLMLIQLGFQQALLASAGVHNEAFHADLFLITPQYQYLLQSGDFPEVRLYQAAAHDRVASVNPVYLAGLPWANPVTHINRMILIMGVPAHRGIFAQPELDAQTKVLRNPDYVLFDIKGRTEYGPVRELFNRGETIVTELANRRVTVAGLFGIGTTFGVDGTVITSDTTVASVLPSGRSKVMLGLLALKPGSDVEAVRTRSRARCRMTSLS